MDPVKRSWWQLKLRLEFHERRGQAFENLFADIMARRHPADFYRSRPWGDQGDRKNDGYLRSTRTMFQVYAPDEMKAAAAVKKIKEDLRGAMKHWDKHLDGWVFVHNGRGLGPQVTKALLDAFAEIQTNHPSRRLEVWSCERIESLVLWLPDDGLPPLPEQDIEAILGPALPLDAMRRVAFADIQPVLEHLASLAPEPSALMRSEVPVEKMDFNALSEQSKSYLRRGYQRAHEVEQFFRRSVDPRLGDRAATGYRAKYQELRHRVQNPDEVFDELWVFTTSAVKTGVQREAAAFVVLAYFFSTCDIFEDAPGVFTAGQSDVTARGSRGTIPTGHET